VVGSFQHGNEHSGSIRGGKYREHLSDCWPLMKEISQSRHETDDGKNIQRKQKCRHISTAYFRKRNNINICIHI
jgi:hypothetical protein